jgi:uncharacterized protein YndB with AHSA1/START domain
MATSKVGPGSDSIVSEVRIAAPPERVFQALVDPRQVPQWWGEPGIYRCTAFHSEARVGGKWRCDGLDGRGNNFQISGEYLEYDPPRVLACSWLATWTGSVKTTVRWELEPSGQDTLVRVIHSGLAAHPEIAQSYRGWPRMLGWLRALLERGETAADRKSATR